MRQNREYWRRQLEAQRRSGLSRRRYCERRGLRAGTFSWWAAKLREEEGSKETALVEVSGRAQPRDGQAAAAPPIELVIGGRYLLRLWRGTDSEQLRELLSALEGGLR